MQPVVIRVWFDPGDVSPNRRMHWARLHSLRKAITRNALYAWIEAGKPRADGKVRVRVVVRRARRMDPDNLLAALKPAIDGLFNARRHDGWGVTPADSSDFVELGAVEQETGSQYAPFPRCQKWVGPHVDFVIEEVTAV